ncbi:hypothetical protein BCR36DRAFT_80508 [Piromyces finnis]|uniref:Uncharacterized protein n=1 Tax=Piromyces finnis TaxID=1754191 RepID=A0A1Y1V6Q1_9FUNG|nr:hypothetical protein BCR36DRAFT_80508 [Piromyces finnis]|eukprot:ORX48401.1 hypothetical protein BCR36DRAFT_80508 [Piromyces finnis]
MNSSNFNESTPNKTNQNIKNSKSSAKKTLKRKKTKKNISVRSSNSSTPVVSVPKLNTIIEHEFANKRVTRSMQQEAKKIKREMIRKERKKNKKVICIEISDDDGEVEENSTLNKNESQKKKKSNENSYSKENLKLIDSTNDKQDNIQNTENGNTVYLII